MATGEVQAQTAESAPYPVKEAAVDGAPAKEDPGAAVGAVDEEAEENARVLEAIEKLIEQGAAAAKDVKEAAEAGLAPGRGLRLRKKSKELQTQAMQLLEPILERVFKQFDADGNGTLEEHELKAAFEAAGRPATDEKIKKAIKKLDTDGDGKISFDEFKALAYSVATTPDSPLKGRPTA